MRILHTIDSAGLYGAESVLLNLVLQQKYHGLAPTILSIGYPNCATKPLETEAARLDLTCIPFRMRDGFNLRGAYRIFQFAKEHGIDVIHSHGYKTNILLAIAPKSLRTCPIVTTLHGWTAKKKLSKLGIYRFLDQALLGRLDAVVVVSEQMRRSKAIRNLNQNAVYSIPNGIAIEQPGARDLPNIGNESLSAAVGRLRQSVGTVIGAVGRLSPEKNFGALVEAVHTVTAAGHPVGAVILGDGPEAGLLRQMIADRNLGERIILGGFIAEARQYFRLFDMLAMPSLTEGLPITLLEAMSAKLPIVATRVGDIAATLGESGILVEPGNTHALANAITKMVENFEYYKNQTTAGAQLIMEKYSAATMSNRYAEAYRSAQQLFSRK